MCISMKEKAEIVHFSTSDVLKETGVSLRQLYYWEQLSIIQPPQEKFGLRMYRRYGPSEIAIIDGVLKYLKEGYVLKTAAQKAKQDVLR
jgi:DNA-binding transcriptional MerR regulator